MAKLKISNTGFGSTGAVGKAKILIPNRDLRAKFNAASSFKDINILLFSPEVVKQKFHNILHSYIEDKVAEDILRLHAMEDEPLTPTAVITRHPNLWKWAGLVFTGWEAAIRYTAAKYPEANINYEAIKNSYQIKREEIIEEIISLIKAGKLTSTTTRDWILSNIRKTHDRACIYYRTWEDAFNTAQVELHKRQIAEFFPKPKITKNPGFLS
jgi:hypothetical protein